jgi:bifunctional polynucleotide phosphatase/kinase
MWRLGTLHIGRPTIGIDLDWTLIRPASAHKHPRGFTDWMFLFPDAVEKLKTIGKQHNIVIFSNQTTSMRNEEARAKFQTKLDAITKALGQKPSWMVASGYCLYRKPKPHMWSLWRLMSKIKSHQDDIYVGDAAGRPKDFADSDLHFAKNCGVRFQIPEEFFLGARPNAEIARGAEAAVGAPPASANPPTPSFVAASAPEVVLMMGSPGSGKTTWIRKHMPEYSRVSRDELRTPAKCRARVRRELDAGNPVVVDNTNPTAIGRHEYIELAQRAGVPVRCVCIGTNPQMSGHLNAMREDHPDPLIRKARVPPIGERMYWSKLELPTMEDGYSDIVHVPFEYSEGVTPKELFERKHR